MMLQLICVILFLVCPIRAQTYQVTTSNGIVEGIQNFTDGNNSAFYSFRGIPYAQPPIGDLRFRPPVPMSNWSGVLNAKNDGNWCTQLSSDLIPKTLGSEDCLFINIYTPQLPTNNSVLLPVLLWIHGGMFLQGSGSSFIYGPDYMIDENIVIVTLNYRLGVFGFLSTNDNEAPGNFGLKDQLLALKWARDNVAFFGGNPSNITLAGQSAGSASVAILTQSSETKGLFHKVIMESGSGLCRWSLSRNARSVAFATGTALGIIAANTTQLIERLRQVPYATLNTVSTLTQFISIIASNNPLDGLVFAPVIEENQPGSIYNFKSYENFLNGNFANVTYLIGFNSNEGAVFNSLIEFVRIYLLTFDIRPVSLVPADMNINKSSSLAAALNIRRKYFGLLPVSLQTTATIIHFVSTDQFERAIIAMVRLISRIRPVYFYEFVYEGNLGLLTMGVQTNRTFQGVAHSEELGYIWKFLGEAAINTTESDQRTRLRMVRMWTNFVKSNNPTPVNDDLLENVSWPITRINSGILSGDLKYLEIGNDLILKNNPVNDDMMYWDALYTQYGNPPYDTY